MRRVIVCGGRDFADRELIARTLYQALDVRSTDQTVVVHGAARGADRLAAEIAENWGLATEAHPADWKAHGKGAGPVRNEEMARLGADLCIAFPGGAGTADMVRRAEAHGIPVMRV